MINLTAIYVLWLREIKRFIRAKSRVFAALAMPVFFLAFIGFGFYKIRMPNIPEGINYINFLVPGIVGMTMLFSSTFAGLSVLWDREFGFLKEIMVAPISRVSIVIGRIAGGTTTALLQAVAILCISIFMGFKIQGLVGFFISILFMVLIATTFIGLGLIFASNMRDMQGFGLIMNFIVFPLFFLSGALFPIKNLPSWIRWLSYVDPLTYGVDGLRGALIGVCSFSVGFNLVVLFVFSLFMIAFGAYFFEKSEPM